MSTKRAIKDARAAGLDMTAVVTSTDARIEIGKSKVELPENVMTLAGWRALRQRGAVPLRTEEADRDYNEALARKVAPIEGVLSPLIRQFKESRVQEARLTDTSRLAQTIPHDRALSSLATCR